jgi:hypothetical protein
MSWLPTAPPDVNSEEQASVEMVILPRTSDIGGFEVYRALPFKNKRMVGPFIFWDQMGPGEFVTGQGIDVRPHPHIGLSTVTYLFDGTLDHKDSLGNDMRITKGDINLMSAGRGITHSERTGHDIRQAPSNLFGIQSWLAQPLAKEESAPAFHHFTEKDLPHLQEKDITGQVMLGAFQGLKSPIPTDWDTLYVDLQLKNGATTSIPKLTEERAIYIMSGSLEIDGIKYPPQQMIILYPDKDITVKALGDTHFLLLGGAVMDGPRYIYWNFVSSSKDRLEQAKEDWTKGRFAKIPGDDEEFIPLP